MNLQEEGTILMKCIKKKTTLIFRNINIKTYF